jgi:hypothetical protein
VIRNPAQEIRINEIADTETYVSVIGTVVLNNPVDYTMMIDDGTGQVEVFGERLCDIGSIVRVIGKPFEDGKGLNAEIIQDFSKATVTLLNKVKAWEGRL